MPRKRSAQASLIVQVLLLLACGLLTAGWAGAQSAAVQSTVAANASPMCPPPADLLTPERMQQGLRNAQNVGPLWRITKVGQSPRLYGTAHLASADGVLPERNVVTTMQQADVLALELNVLDSESLKPLTQPADPALIARVLDAPRAARVARQVALACPPPGALSKLRPAMQAAALVAFDAMQSSFYIEFGIDAMLAGLAQ